MADGIQFYRQNGCIALGGSEETQDFTSRFNKCFDALNRKYAAEGIIKDSLDFKVITFTLIHFSFSHNLNINYIYLIFPYNFVDLKGNVRHSRIH